MKKTFGFFSFAAGIFLATEGARVAVGQLPLHPAVTADPFGVAVAVAALLCGAAIFFIGAFESMTR